MQHTWQLEKGVTLKKCETNRKVGQMWKIEAHLKNAPYLKKGKKLGKVLHAWKSVPQT